MMQSRRQIFAIAAATLAAPAILRAQPTVSQAAIPDALAADGRFSSFIELLSRSAAMNTLRGGGRFTLFAPTDAGVETIPINIREGLTPTPNATNSSGVGDQAALSALCNLHIVDGVYPLESFTAASTLLRSRNGTALKVDRTSAGGLQVMVADSEGPKVGGLNFARPGTILAPVVLAGNGIILPIDTALLN